MNPRRYVALQFVERFCRGDVDALGPLLVPDLTFRGPLFRFDTRDAYLESLGGETPVRGTHDLISVTEDGADVTVIYEYRKPDASVLIAQLFRFRDDRIAETLVIFDTAAGLDSTRFPV